MFQVLCKSPQSQVLHVTFCIPARALLPAPTISSQLPKMVGILLQMTQMEEVGRRNLWLNAQQEQAMDMQYSQMQAPARSGESLHPGDGRTSAKSPMAIFAQTPSPTAPSSSRPYPQSGHTVSRFPIMLPELLSLYLWLTPKLQHQHE